MLLLLHIENIAVIQSADIQFDGGFNVLTGETGAGKSIVVDALNAVLGGRTSRDLIRTGAKSALVSAQFIDLPQLDWFQEQGIAPDAEGVLLLQRELRADGKNTCRLNGRPVSLAQLRELGRQLLDIHGQHDGQRLLDPACHLEYLDSFGQCSPLLADYQTAYHKLTSLKKQMDSLKMDEAEKARRVDNLTYQIAELERADLRPGEDEALAERKKLLRSAGKIMGAVDSACYALFGSDETQGALDLVEEAADATRQAGRYSDAFGELAEKLESLRYDLDDAAECVRDKREEMEFSPSELDQLESRLDIIYRLQKKYGSTVEEMLQYLERCRAELETIQSAADTLEKLEQKLQAAQSEAAQAAAKLTALRKKQAVRLQQRIQKELADLDMPKVRFEVAFTGKACTFGMDETGADEVQFLMSANVGEDLKPIQKIASGGELARIMLALKNVLAENETVTTLVFDEVDTGVSGRAAQKVARKMADVGQHKQVLCVTHLPQIAAMADVHFSVEKGERDGRTYTQVERLSQQRRKEELARLTGGAVISDAILKSAGELLTEAEGYKQNRKKQQESS